MKLDLDVLQIRTSSIFEIRMESLVIHLLCSMLTIHENLEQPNLEVSVY